MLDRRRARIPDRLWQALFYVLSGGGKRVRPALLLACFDACGGEEEDRRAMPAAMAVDCIHTYSLIHDDLPCMDDDDMRRGQPACHRRFDEATAVLAGDALQALAFELICDCEVPDAVRVALVRGLARAAGGQGMVGGQMLDMEAEGAAAIDLPQVEHIHLHKTGALLRFCCEAGALLAGADEERRRGCIRFGEAVGLLFQIVDDLLDVTATSAALGKRAGKDAARGKATSVALLGVDGARERAREMAALAADACRTLEEGRPGSATALMELTDYLLHRGS
ncbi:MAG: polyprenyl synthetase family protein [Zetaproteobacteria bacterium]|nr:MAG: polyprenyl synthetase family protein [Zetaproteobacteria bacterium]